jgi:hypothetical protein
MRPLLVDSCDRCQTHNSPTRHHLDGDEILARYRCQACMWSWICRWGLLAFTVEERATIEESATTVEGRGPVRWRDMIGPGLEALDKAGEDRPGPRWVTEW